MNFLRTASTRRIIAGSVLSVALVAGGVAAAMASGGGGTPPPGQAARRRDPRLAGRAEAHGLTARVHFTNNLIASGALPAGSPLLTGADGRLWISGDRARLELQSDAGDAQITVDDGDVSIYDASSNTVYKAQVGTRDAADSGGADASHGVPSTAEISSALTQLAQQATLSGADPTTQAGQPAYNVSVTPKHDAGLLGHGRGRLGCGHAACRSTSRSRAAGSSSPVLALDVTDISYGSVDAAALAITRSRRGEGRRSRLARSRRCRRLAGHVRDAGPGRGSGRRAVHARRARHARRPAPHGRAPGQRRQAAGRARDLRPGPRRDRRDRALGHETSGQADNPLAGLPAVSIGGATGHELPTALGTVITVERGGVSYTLLGSLPPNAAEAALRAVLA